jgi:hypothetical protein
MTLLADPNHGHPPSRRKMAASTKAEASHRLGRGRPWLLLLVGDPPERQSAAESSAGDKAGVWLRLRADSSLHH